MPVYLDDLMKILAQVCEEKNLTAAVSESLKGGLLTGAAALCGGLLLGPVGLALGGALGGGISALSAKNKFQSVGVILMKLPTEKKQMLYEEIKYAFRDFDETDILALCTLIAAEKAFKDKSIEVVKNFLSKKMNLQIKSN